MAGAIPPYQRFLKSYCVCPDTGCWLWEGAKYQNGYGWLKVFGKVVSAHRFSYELHKGSIPEGMHILHSCDVRHCVNPDHLRVGTHQENMREAAERGRMPTGDQHPMAGKPNPRRGINCSQSKPVLVLGKAYGSIKEAEGSLGLGAGTVRWWINNKPEKAKEISREDFRKLC